MRGSAASTPVLGETGKKEAHVETVEQAGVKVGSLARREAMLVQEGLEIQTRHRVILKENMSVPAAVRPRKGRAHADGR